jgi:putative nucleotidyltransferase with HDIG domain
LDHDIVLALVRAIELKDLSTAAHTWRVSLYTRALAESLGLREGLADRMALGAALHDIGKIDVPTGVLRNRGELTPGEREQIRRHPVFGHERLVRMGESDDVVLGIVRSHHERFDGTGYPDGLRGERIPIAARYFAVVDTFDALTSVRPYRREIGQDAVVRAVAQLRLERGTRYDDEAVGAFVELLESGRLDWIQHYYNDQVPVKDFDHRRGLEDLVREGGAEFKQWLGSRRRA